MQNETEIVNLPTPAATVRVGGLADETEEWSWQHDLAQKPAKLVIYPYRVGPNFQAELTQKIEEANASNQAHLNLAVKEGALSGELLAFDDDEFLDDKEVEAKLKVVQGLDRVRAKLAQLNGAPRFANQVIADWFVHVIKSHNLVDENLQPLPLTREGFLKIEQGKFGKLYEDLRDFLSSGRRRQKRI